jgi:hypothetical protein
MDLFAIGTATITIMAALFNMAMLSINVNLGLLRKGGILGCWRPRVFRGMKIYGDGFTRKVDCGGARGLTEATEDSRIIPAIAESGLGRKIVQQNPEGAAVIVPLYGWNTL